jgi:hypothetical protein
MARAKRFRTRQQVECYFGGETIECLLCGKNFRKLNVHLFHKHAMSADEYKERFGLPWTRGLTSAASHARAAKSWTKGRRHQQSRTAKNARLFDCSIYDKRKAPPFLLRELVERNRHGRYGDKFEHRVRALFDRGLTDGEIAKRIKVNRMTVNLRTRRWRKSRRS